MKLARRYNTLSCLTALLSALAYCAADEGTFILALLSILACTAAYLTGRDNRPWALPRWGVNLLMLAAIIDALLKVLGGRAFTGFWAGAANTPIVSVLAHFLTYILLAKLFDRRTARDEAHVLSLCVFVVVGAVLTSNSLVVGLLIIAFAPCIICSAMLLQLVGGERAADDWDRSLSLPHAPASDLPQPLARRFRRDFTAAAAAATLGTLALATLAFLFMPRGMGRDVLGGFGKVADGATVAFTDRITLGNNGFLKPDQTAPVLRVRVSDSAGRDLADTRGTLYLRGAVKTSYDRRTRTWIADEPVVFPTSRADRDAPRDDPSWIIGDPVFPRGSEPGFHVSDDRPLILGRPESGSIFITQHITLLTPLRLSGYFFTVWRPIELRTAQPWDVARPRRDAVLRTGRSGSLEGYTVVSALEFTDPSEPPTDPIPFPSTVIRDIAEGILKDRGVPISPADRDAAANRRATTYFLDYLRTTCVYSTEMIKPEEGEDPIEMFVTRTRSGHCEYFASALVALCQCVGLDARLVAGYLATEFDRSRSEYVVRESNAHAWTEVRLAPGRWQRFDPSPPEALDLIHRPALGLLARLRRWYESINTTWTGAVISFDVEKQETLLGSSGWLAGSFSNISEALTHLRRRLGAVTGIVRLAIGAIVLTLLVVVINRHRRRARHAGDASPADAHHPTDPAMERLLEQAGFYPDALALLRRAGLAKPAHRPPALHAGSIAPQAGPAAAAFASLTDAYYRVRFGRLELSPAQAAAAHKDLATLESLLAAPSHNAPPPNPTPLPQVE